MTSAEKVAKSFGFVGTECVCTGGEGGRCECTGGEGGREV